MIRSNNYHYHNHYHYLHVMPISNTQLIHDDDLYHLNGISPNLIPNSPGGPLVAWGRGL